VPGIVFGFSQPIKQRMAELIAGARGDVVVKLFGDDLDTLRESADAIVRALRGVPGAEDVRAEQVSGLPMRRVAVDRRAAARYGVRVGDVLDTVNALGGITVGRGARGGALLRDPGALRSHDARRAGGARQPARRDPRRPHRAALPGRDRSRTTPAPHR
jgi:Cu/Ag efflux pump CusA